MPDDHMKLPDAHDMPDSMRDRERRLDALRALTASATTSRPPGAEPASELTIAPPQSLRPPRVARRGSRRTAVLAVLLLLVILIVAGGVALGIRGAQRTPHVAAGPLYIDLTALHLPCPADMAWSPDGKTLALLGYDTGCSAAPGSGGSDSPDPRGGELLFFDGQHGRLLRRVALDAPVLQQSLSPNVLNNPTNELRAGYDAPIWTPDG
ncbi:MAG: hypothetical protein ACHQ4H_05700, partial [Ktedonobacterales bacterium]